MASVQFGNTRQVYGFNRSELQSNQNRAYANKQTTSRYSHISNTQAPVLNPYENAVLTQLEKAFQEKLKAEGRLYSFPDFVKYIRQSTIPPEQKEKFIRALRYAHQSFNYGAMFETNTRYEAPNGHLNLLAFVAATAKPLPGAPVAPIVPQAPTSILKKTRKHRKTRKQVRKQARKTRR